MAIDYDRLMARSFPDREHAFTRRDTILYALGVGLGADPMDTGQLGFVTETHLKALPSMVNILGYPGFWASQPDTGIDWRKVVHAEQSFVLHAPLPAAGTVIGRTRVAAIHDRGPGRGAFLRQDRQVLDAVSGESLATVSQLSLLRGDGGFGGPAGTPEPPHAVPSRGVDLICDLPTLPQAALIYRLSGDDNPLHADPEVAAAAGFPRPILHGLCTMGVACHAVLRAVCAYDPARLRAMRVRFTAPVLPGDTLRTSLWVDGPVVSLRCHALERDVLVLDAGRVDLTP